GEHGGVAAGTARRVEGVAWRETFEQLADDGLFALDRGVRAVVVRRPAGVAGFDVVLGDGELERLRKVVEAGDDVARFFDAPLCARWVGEDRADDGETFDAEEVFAGAHDVGCGRFVGHGGKDSSGSGQRSAWSSGLRS